MSWINSHTVIGFDSDHLPIWLATNIISTQQNYVTQCIFVTEQQQLTDRQLKQSYPAATAGDWQTSHSMNQYSHLDAPAMQQFTVSADNELIPAYRPFQLSLAPSFSRQQGHDHATHYDRALWFMHIQCLGKLASYLEHDVVSPQEH